MTRKFFDAIDPKIKFSFVESSEVDGQHIIGKVRGCFFCPDGTSRNNRFYSKELWERALSKDDVKEKFEKKNMFGSIGHNIEITDETLGKGLISHIVTDAYIDEAGQGIGEALILNTPAGQILNTVLRAGSTVYVSSRGEGEFKGTKNGIPNVDEDSYNLIGWDFVLNPGFLKANPRIAESLEELENNDKGDNVMDKLLEKLTSENSELKVKLERALDEGKKLNESVASTTKENTELKSQVETVTATSKNVSEELASVKSVLAKFEELADSPEDAKKALTSADTYITKVNEELGSFEDIKKSLKLAINFKEEVDKLGTLSEIKTALKIAGQLVEEQEEVEKDARIAALASELGVEKDAVAELIAKGMTDEEIKSVLQKVAESFKKTTVIKSKFVKKNESKIITEEKEVKAIKTASRLSRIMEDLA